MSRIHNRLFRSLSSVTALSVAALSVGIFAISAPSASEARTIVPCDEQKSIQDLLADANKSNKAGVPFRTDHSRTCADSEGVYRKQSIHLSVGGNGLVRASVVTYAANNLDVQSKIVRPDHTVENWVMAGLAVGTGVILWKVAAKQGSKKAEQRLEQRAADRAEGARQAGAAATTRLEMPKTVNPEAMGVPGAKSSSATVAGAIPESQVPPNAARFTDSSTGNVYITQTNPSTNLLEFMLISNMINRPYFYPGSYYAMNPWDMGMYSSPYMYGNGAVIVEPGYAPTFYDRPYGGDAYVPHEYMDPATQVVQEDSYVAPANSSGPDAPGSDTIAAQEGGWDQGGAVQADTTGGATTSTWVDPTPAAQPAADAGSSGGWDSGASDPTPTADTSSGGGGWDSGGGGGGGWDSGGGGGDTGGGGGWNSILLPVIGSAAAGGTSASVLLHPNAAKAASVRPAPYK